MDTQIINGRKIRDTILEEVKKEIKKLSFVPVFCDILVGDDIVSRQYVLMKSRIAESVGIKFYNAEFPENITSEELVREIEKINNIENICGIIVQLPLPAHIDRDFVLNSIKKDLDVDCLGKDVSEDFYKNIGSLGFPASIACMYIIDSLNLDLNNKNIVVIGQGMLVGKPLTHILKNRNLHVEVVTKDLINKEQIIKNADILISATGDGNFIKGDMIKQGCIIIDAGTSESSGGIVGDVDFESVKGVASIISRVPGGVGPVTVACLLKNILKVALNKQK